MLGAVAAAVYGDPAHGLPLIGVTGTNGKTTHDLPASRPACAPPGTAHRADRHRRAPGSPTSGRRRRVRTTPEAPDLHALLAVMRERGVDGRARWRSPATRWCWAGSTGCVFDVAVLHQPRPRPPRLPRRPRGLLRRPRRRCSPRRGPVAAWSCVDDEWGRRLRRAAGMPVTRTRPTAGAGRGLARRRASTRLPGGSDVHPRTARTGCDVAAGLPAARRVQRRQRASRARRRCVDAGVDPATARGRDRGVPRRPRPDGAGRRRASRSSRSSTTRTRPTRSTRAAARPPRGRRRRPGDRRARLRRRPRPPASAPTWAGSPPATPTSSCVTDDNPRSEDPAAIRAAMLAGAADAGAAAVARGARPAAPRSPSAVAGAEPGDIVLVAGQGPRDGPGGRRAWCTRSTTASCCARRSPAGRPSVIALTLAEVAAATGGALAGDGRTPRSSPGR